MSSEVDIVNLALSHLGDTANVATISPPDGSMQAEYAAKFFPMARDSLLELHDWGFATAFGTLAQLTNTSTTWSYAYAAPSDLIKVVGSVPEGFGGDTLFRETVQEEIAAFGHPAWYESLNRHFATMGGVIYSNEAAAAFVYTRRIEDTTRFSPLFVDALTWRLASLLAGPILKGSTGKTAAADCLKMFHVVMGWAATSDANQQSSTRAAMPPWMAGR